jgi:hypothetical protein
MTKILEWAKDHPAGVGGIVVVGGLGLILVLRRGVSSQSGVATAAIQSSAQVAAVQAQSAAQLASINAQSQVENNKTAAQLALGLFATKTQGDVSKYQTTTQGNIASQAINADVTEKLNATATASSIYGREFDILKQQQQNSYDLSQSALNQTGTVHGSQNRVAIISAALNQPGIGVAAENGQTTSSISGDNLLGGLFATIGKTITGLFG